MAPDPLEPNPQPPCAGLLEPMLTDAVIDPHTEEAGTYNDVDPEEDHEEPSHITMGHAQELT